MQYDAFEIGFITTDDFTNADILEATYPAVAKRLLGDWNSDPAIPIVTGFLGKVFHLAILLCCSSILKDWIFLSVKDTAFISIQKKVAITSISFFSRKKTYNVVVFLFNLRAGDHVQ